MALMAWKRPAIERRCYDSLGSLEMPEGWEMDVLVVGSEGERSRRAAEERGFTYVEFPNEPLGAKANHRLTVAREMPWDYIMTWATDAICTQGFLWLYEPSVSRGVPRIEIQDRWHHDTRTGETYYFPGHFDRPDNVGIGRMISRSAVEACGWKLWDDEQTRALDREMDRRLAASGYPAGVALMTAGTEEAALELKSEQQITVTDALNAKSVPMQPTPKIARLLEGIS